MILWTVVILAAITIFRITLRYMVAACSSKTKMGGKVVVVTGANTGIGFETAKNLAKRGARVILACRNESKGLQARDRIVQETSNHNIEYRHLDLSSLSSVRKFAEDINKNEEKLDVLVNNAGVFGLADQYTEDGIIKAMQVNLFAPMLLIDLLINLLKKSSGRIVNVSSLILYGGTFNAEKINEKGYYGNLRTYTNSKFGMMVYTYELAHKLRESGVTVNACHPGIVHTNIIDTKSHFVFDFLLSCLSWLCWRSEEEAAQTPVYLSVAEGVQNIKADAGGKFYVDCNPWPVPVARTRKVGPSLWAVAEKLLKHQFQSLN